MNQKQPNRIFLLEKLPLKVIKDCKTVFAFKFKRRLGLNLNGVFNTKEQTLLEATMYVYEGGNM